MKNTTWKWIRKTIKNKVWLIGLLSLVQSLNAACGIVFALFMRRTIDFAVSGDQAGFIESALLLLGAILFRVCLRALNRFLDEETRAIMENGYRRRFFRVLLNREYKVISGYHTGDLMNRMTSDAQVITDGLVTLFPGLVAIGVHLIGALGVLYTIQPLFTVVFLVGGILVAAASVLPRNWLKRTHHQVQETDGAVRSFVQECLESLMVIRAFGCERKMDEEGDARMRVHRQARRHRNHVSNFFNTGMGLVIQCGYLFGLVFCGYGILQGTISYGTLIAVQQLVGQIQTPFVGLGGLLPKYAAMIGSAERLRELEDEYTDAMLAAEDGLEAGNIHLFYEDMEKFGFSHVNFSYEEGQVVLEDECFEVHKNEIVGLIGTSGAGKSTIMKLLLGVFEPQGGEIYFQIKKAQGVREKVAAGNAPRGLFAYVPQGNHLMSGTIRQVVAFADRTDAIADDRVKWACHVACADEFIEELPLGYETVLGEKGAGLSEGQMQRLAVARAVYSECPILLLDEATASLDAMTERLMMERLKHLENRTVLMITHRKEAWTLCDRVLERKGD